jgi:hypothetical protein
MFVFLHLYIYVCIFMFVYVCLCIYKRIFIKISLAANKLFTYIFINF